MQDSTSGHGGPRPGAGRPRRPPTLAGAVRAAFPVERLIAMAEQLATSASEDTRKWALQWLSERGHGKTPDRMELGPAGSMGADEAEDERLSRLPPDKLREALAKRRELDALLDEGDEEGLALLPESSSETEA